MTSQEAAQKISATADSLAQFADSNVGLIGISHGGGPAVVGIANGPGIGIVAIGHSGGGSSSMGQAGDLLRQLAGAVEEESKSRVRTLVSKLQQAALVPTAIMADVEGWIRLAKLI